MTIVGSFSKKKIEKKKRHHIRKNDLKIKNWYSNRFFNGELLVNCSFGCIELYGQKQIVNFK